MNSRIDGIQMYQLSIKSSIDGNMCLSYIFLIYHFIHLIGKHILEITTVASFCLNRIKAHLKRKAIARIPLKNTN